MKKTSPYLLPFVLVGLAGAADFNPIPLTPASYNADVVVEKEAPGPLGRATRATMDGGTNNTGFTYYEIGYNTASPGTGVPLAGSTFTHQSFSDHSYTMAPSYTSSSNGILITPPAGGVTNGTFTLTTPAPYSSLSVLAAGGNGGVVVNYVVHFADASTETGTIPIGDWFGGANPAYTTMGRANAQTSAFDNVGLVNPRLYGYDIVLVNTASAVTSIDFTFASGTGRDGIFALSGAPVGGGAWTPIPVTGYAYDMIIEASAPQAGTLTTATTVSMDGGTANTGNTWYERGYDPFNPNTGLPAPGIVITSTDPSKSDHHYLMPASYTAPNAIYVDATLTTVNIGLANPSNYSALSFLNATANGAVTVQCTMQYEDGSSEINTFVAKDWFNNAPIAFTASGRLNLNNKTFNNVNASNPRLYEAEFVLGNTVSRITNVVMQWLSAPNANARVVVLAVSATAGALKPIFGLQPQPANTYDGMSVTFNATLAGGTQPISVQWQKGTNGAFVDLMNAGNISGATTTNLAIASVSLADVADYRLVATNTAGGSTSVVARLTVLSPLMDVTSPSDVITAFGGLSPAGEEVLHAIDNVTQKYLNYGSGPNLNNPPFVGPVGLIVTPALGPTRVTGLRLYTANDHPDRDPADYSLEGSTDGMNYTLISSNALALPDDRNAGGLITLDPLTQFLQQILFSNPSAYTTYKLTFYNVKNAVADNSMQIAEVELLGTAASVIYIARGPAEDEVTLTSNVDGTLQSATELIGNGPGTVWVDMGPVGPLTPVIVGIPPGQPTRFFRLSTP